MCWWPNQLSSIESGACILIPNKIPIKTHWISSKADQDTDQETWFLISLNTKYSIFAASIITYNNNRATYYFFLGHQNVASSCSLTNSFSSFLHLMWSPSRTPSFISASKQRRNRTNLRKTTHQIQFPKQCISKFWTMRSKSCQLPFVTSVQRIQSFGSIFLLQMIP